MRTACGTASRPICKEAAIRASAYLLVFVALAGCGGGKKAAGDQAPPKKPVLKDPLTIVAVAGSATVRSDKTGQEILYTLRWKEAEINAGDGGIFGGTMEDVSGDLYYKNVASTFSAAAARANREQQLLVLTKDVQVVSKTKRATIECDKVEWHAKEKIVKAFGNVRARGTFGVLSGLNEVWATPDLSVIATPSLFKHP